MKFTGLSFVIFIPALFLSTICLAQRENMAPDGFVLVEENFAIDMQKMPLLFMSDARTDFRNKNYGEAASDIKTAARLIGVEAKQTQSSDARGELLIEEGILTRLAKDLSDGKVTTLRELNTRLADSSYHQAAHHRLRAVEAWSAHQYKNAGHEMALATDTLDQAAKWADRELEKTTTTSIGEIQKVSGELKKGTGWTAAEVKKQMASLDTVISRFGKDIGMGGESVTSSAAKKQPAETGSTSGTTRSVKP